MSLQLPRIIFGSSALGNLYSVPSDEIKCAIVENWVRHQPNPLIDSAGKYGAGLALESIGRCLGKLQVDPAGVWISNKLGWKRVPLTTKEPTFEPGAWFDLEHDAEQCIGYDGILECYHQGNELLGGYDARLLSVHDPDEYLAGADSEAAKADRYGDILGAYRALVEQRESGDVLGIGVGAKDWRIIKRLYNDGVQLDWAMFANTFTILSHPAEVMDFMAELHAAGVAIVNSAVFNAGFLTGGKYFDYELITEESHPEIFDWRLRFTKQCESHGVAPALACCQFALSPPGVVALALNTSRPERVGDNVALVTETAPARFWQALKDHDLIARDYPFL